jgi:hypothetical protein
VCMACCGVVSAMGQPRAAAYLAKLMVCRVFDTKFGSRFGRQRRCMSMLHHVGECRCMWWWSVSSAGVCQ